MKDLLSDIIADVLAVPVEKDKTFDWWARINRFGTMNVLVYGSLFGNVYKALKADYQSLCHIRKPAFPCDAYIGGSYNMIFEYDVLTDFNSYREAVFRLYPEKLKTNFDVEEWISYCETHNVQADIYQYTQKVNGFEGPGGKAAKRALTDFLKDSQPLLEGLNPTLRFCEFEVREINLNNPKDKRHYTIVENLLKKKLKY